MTSEVSLNGLTYCFAAFIIYIVVYIVVLREDRKMYGKRNEKKAENLLTEKIQKQAG